MIRWLSRLSTPLSSPSGLMFSSSYGRSLRKESTPYNSNWTADFASDPAEWERKFEESWKQVEALLDAKTPERDIAYEEMVQLISQLTLMCQLLMMEVNAQPEPTIGQILDRFFTQQIMERVLDWAIQIQDFLKPTCQLALLRIYEIIVSESHTQNHCLLVHKPILNPLLRLFEWCKRADSWRPSLQGHPTPTDKHFVVLLNQICTRLAEDNTLLHFFFRCSEGADQFIVFSLLIPFLYEQNDVGQLARDALLLILSVSSKHEEIAEFVATKSAFCPVVATGLSGCFSQLGRVLAGESSDKILPDHDIESFANFHSSLLFCNAVVQAAHTSVVEQICNFFYSGFLISVVKPALLQEEREGVAAATIYLQVSIETISEPALVKTVIRMLLVEKNDDMVPLLRVIVERISMGDKLAVVSLSLLDCLLQLGCEDLMLVLVLRDLLPMRHLTRNRLAKVRDSAQAVSAAQMLLNCIPECMLRFPEVSSQSTLKVYMQEGAQLVDLRTDSCLSWKWKYDGVSPSPLLFRHDSDEEMDGHMPFTRLSSCRSSMSSASFGLNRYFGSRNAHLTTESNIGIAHLAELGGSPSRSLYDSESPVEEDAEFILPTINTSCIMNSSMVDYFQLATYDDLSENEESSGSPERKLSHSKKSRLNSVRRDSTSLPSEPESSTTAGRGFDTDAEMARSFVLSGWDQVEDLDTFVSLLDRRAVHSKCQTSVTETMAYIDSKLQYMKELHNETMQEYDRVETVDSTTVKMQAMGQPIDECIDSSQFLKCLFSQMEKMCEHSLVFNLQLANALSSLAAYPQPLLAAYLFSTQTSDRFPQMIEILSTVKRKVDALAISIEGLDVWVGRALRTLNGKVEKMERQSENSWMRMSDSPRDETLSPISSLLRGRSFTTSGRRMQGFRYHSHKAVESMEVARDDAATKNVVHAAIVLANLCQFLAGIALRQSVVIVRNTV